MSTNPAATPDPAASPPWPLAVGVLVLPDGVPEAARVEHRLALALGAYRIGYFLLDLVEVDGRSIAGPAGAWAPVEHLVRRTVPDAVVVRNVAPIVLPRRLPDTLTAVPLRFLGE